MNWCRKCKVEGVQEKLKEAMKGEEDLENMKAKQKRKRRGRSVKEEEELEQRKTIVEVHEKRKNMPKGNKVNQHQVFCNSVDK